jgi:pilus retraction protein PilT
MENEEGKDPIRSRSSCRDAKKSRKGVPHERRERQNCIKRGHVHKINRHTTETLKPMNQLETPPMRGHITSSLRRSKSLLDGTQAAARPLGGSIISRSQRLAEKAMEFPSKTEKEANIAKGADLLRDLIKSHPGASDLQFRADRYLHIQSGGATRVLPQYGRLSPHLLAGITLALYRSKTGGGRDSADDSHEIEDAEFTNRLGEQKRVDFAAEGGDVIEGVLECGRMRVQTFFEHAGLGVTCRILRDEIVALEDLNYSADTADRLRQLCLKRGGLGLVTGVTGAGKSTTLASLLMWIKNTQGKHIVTIEEPIEYQFSEMLDDGSEAPSDSLITQQEVGIHVPTFRAGLIDALRKRPNIIMVGEIRDKETMSTALEAAQTGHLVLSTLHTRGAAATIARILEWFPKEEAPAILGQLSETLLFVLSQDLFPSVSKPNSLALCYEFLLNSENATRTSILKYDGNPASLDQALRQSGGIAWDDQLERLVAEGHIARDFANNHYRRSKDARSKDAS